MQIYERIKNARLKSGLTPEALAEKIGVPRTTYLYWEESTPKPEKVMSVAIALGLPENYFFISGDDEKEDTIDEKTADNFGTHQVSEPHVEYIKPSNNSADYLAGRLAEKEATIEQIEKRIQDALSFAKKMEAHYLDSKSEKDRLYKIVEDYLKDIHANSNKSKEAIQNLRTEMIAENGEMMATLDQIAGNEPGTTASKAGTLEIAHRVHKTNKDKKAGTGKRG